MHSLDIDGMGRLSLWTVGKMGRSPCVKISIHEATYDRVLRMFRVHMPLSLIIENDVKERLDLYGVVVSAWDAYKKEQ